MGELELLQLLQLSDPTLPIGGFSHSAGLETYVQQGLVHDVSSAEQFITNQVRYNLGYTDAALLSLAYDAAIANDPAGISDLDCECNALKLPRELREASQKLGLRLLKIFAGLQPADLVKDFLAQVQSGKGNGHYCIAFGVCAAAAGIGKKSALTAFLYNAAVGMVTNSVKLVPLGQQAGQQLLYRLHPLVAAVAGQCMEPDRQMIGMCCTGFDIRSMQHEHLYSRLYMS